MRKKVTKLTFIALCIVTHYAIASPPKPAKCPNVNVLQGTEFSHALADKHDSDNYIVYNVNNYRTTDKWFFGIGIKGAKTKKRALKLAKRSLTSLHYMMGPILSDDGESWACFYMAQNNVAFSITPVPPMPQALQYFHR